MYSSIFPRGSSNWRRAIVPWLGVIAAPLLWLVLLQTNYVLAYPTCASRSHAAFYVSSAAALLIVLVIGFTVVYVWRTDPPEIREGPLRLEQMHDAKEQDPSLTSRHFMAIVGLFSSILFLLLVIGTSLPPVVLHPCD